jgi:hypothetical protein
VVLKTDDPDPYLVLGPEGDADEGAPGVALMGETGPMAIGAVQDLTLDLPHGQYVLICNLTENALHYQQGQHTFLNVK